MKSIYKQRLLAFHLVYEGDEGNSGNNGDDATIVTATTAPTQTNGQANSGGDDTGLLGNTDGRVTFTKEQQELINKRWAAEKKKLKSENEKTITQLQALQQKAGLSEQEKGKLQARIEELQQQTMTKEELAKKEREKLEKEHKAKIEATAAERDKYKNLFYNSTVERAILDAATSAEAWRAEQLVPILRPFVQLLEEEPINEGDLPRYVPKVKLRDTNSEGQAVTLDLTLDQAMKRLKDKPEQYGNLFKSGVAGGLGQTGTAPRRKHKDPKDMSPAEWKEFRKTNPDLNVENIK